MGDLVSACDARFFAKAVSIFPERRENFRDLWSRPEAKRYHSDTLYTRPVRTPDGNTSLVRDAQQAGDAQRDDQAQSLPAEGESDAAAGQAPSPHAPSSASSTALSSAPAPPRRRRALFALLALLLGLAPFVLLELSLRLLGVEADAASTDLHDGFDDDARLFQPDGDLLTTDIGRERFFARQSFAAEKPADEFRIFVLGGSTVQGRPYLPDTSFGHWLGEELNLVGRKNYRVINCGGISYASFRLRPLVEEVLTYDPDLIVVATGHNEFLEDRTYAALKSRSSVRMWVENSARSLRTVMLLRRLTGGAARVEPTTETQSSPREIQTRLDDPSGYASYQRDDAWQDSVVTQFADSVQLMTQACRDAQVPLVLVKLGANLRDCPPFKSEHDADLTVENQQQWQALFDEATALDDADPAGAIALYQQALELDEQFALLHFRLGRCCDRTGDHKAAARHYQQAVDRDVCPLRMTTRLHERLTDIATTQQVPLVDAEAAVRHSAPEGICGFESYIDHVHPTIAAHQLIGHVIAEQLVADGQVPATSIATQRQRRRMYGEIMTALGDIYFSNGRRRIGWLEGWAQRNRLQQELTPVDLRGFVATASRNLDLHRFEEAENELSIALDLQDDPAAVVDLAQRLFGAGRNLDAKWLLSTVVSRYEGRTLPPDVSMGLLAIALDEGDQATLDAVAKNPAWAGQDLPTVLAADPSGWGELAGTP